MSRSPARGGDATAAAASSTPALPAPNTGGSVCSATTSRSPAPSPSAHPRRTATHRRRREACTPERERVLAPDGRVHARRTSWRRCYSSVGPIKKPSRTVPRRRRASRVTRRQPRSGGVEISGVDDAPAPSVVAFRRPLRIQRRTVSGLRPTRLAASSTVNMQWMVRRVAAVTRRWSRRGGPR